MIRSRKLGALIVALSLSLGVTAGCKKKVPPPAPPPAPVKIEAPPAPPAKPSATLTVEPSTVEKGQAATLKWSVTGETTSVTIDPGIGAVSASGSRQVYPSASTTYTLRATGPGGEDTATATVTLNTPPPPPPPTPRAPKVSFSEMISQQLQDVYFDYDRSDIREDARATLTRDADSLKQIFQTYNTGGVVIEGHADERGSAEYNLGLSDRRATAAKEFLVQLGVPSDRLQTVSYGRERPQCTESDESCWQKNRRAHFAAGQ